MADDPQLPSLHSLKLARNLFCHVCQHLPSSQDDEIQAQLLVEAAFASTSVLLKHRQLYFGQFGAAMHDRLALNVEEAELDNWVEAGNGNDSGNTCVAAGIRGGPTMATDGMTDADLKFGAWFEAWEACAIQAFNQKQGAQILEILPELMPNLSYLWLLAISNLVSASHSVLQIFSGSIPCSTVMMAAADEDTKSMGVEQVAENEPKSARFKGEDAFEQANILKFQKSCDLGGSFDVELENLERNLTSKLGSLASGLGLSVPQDDLQGYISVNVLSCTSGNFLSLVVERARAIDCSLYTVWPEINGAGGLKARPWRARAMAAYLVENLSEYDITAMSEKWHNPVERGPSLSQEGIVAYEELLHQLCFGLALSDSKWQVRLEAVKSSTKMMLALQPYINRTLFIHSIWGILAATEDRQSEVKDVAVKAIRLDICPHFPDCDMAILDLVDEFVAVASLNASGDKAYNKELIESNTFDHSPEARALIAALTGAIRLKMLPIVPSNKGKKSLKHDIDRVPLIVAATSYALHKSDKTSNRSLSMSLETLLRSLSLYGYSESLLGMLHSNGPSYMGASIAEYYREASITVDETSNTLEKLSKLIVLKGLSLALEGLGSDDSLISDFSEASPYVYELAQRESKALGHIVKVLEIPAHLTNIYNQTTQEPDGEEFLLCAYPLLRMAKTIAAHPLWLMLENQDRNKLVEQLILCCAAFASANEGNAALWTTQKHQELATSVASVLSNALYRTCKADSLDTTESHIHNLILPYFPSIAQQLKQTIKDSLHNEENLYTLPKSGNLKDSIVSAYQMRWIIKQVKHPYLGRHVDVVMPCVLIALDHPSPAIKRQAMTTLIHLSEALNPSELRWYKDVILDAVCRSLIGSDELWELAVKMAMSLVICIEGRNPRGLWYRRILDNMLGELERHNDDQQRRLSWLQTIKPLIESMGLVLVVQFKRLFPLLFYWLHHSDEATCIMVLSIMPVIIKQTWPRISFHTSQILEEVIQVYKSSKTSKHHAQIHALVVDVCKLLQKCGESQFQAAWDKYQNDSSIEPLVSALKSLE